MMWYIYSLFGILLRRQVFDVNEGNDDWRDLIDPEKYGLSQTQNFYIPVMLHYCSKRPVLLLRHIWFVRFQC